MIGGDKRRSKTSPHHRHTLYGPSNATIAAAYPRRAPVFSIHWRTTTNYRAHGVQRVEVESDEKRSANKMLWCDDWAVPSAKRKLSTKIVSMSNFAMVVFSIRNWWIENTDWQISPCRVDPFILHPLSLCHGPRGLLHKWWWRCKPACLVVSTLSWCARPGVCKWMTFRRHTMCVFLVWRVESGAWLIQPAERDVDVFRFDRVAGPRWGWDVLSKYASGQMLLLEMD